MMNKNIFILPDKGIFAKNGVTDPILYYYKPIIGKMYCNRIQQGLSLLPRREYENAMEFGYGSGFLLPSLLEISNSLWAVDIESEPGPVKFSLAKMKITKDIVFIKGDINVVDLPKNHFDLIVAFSVFEHIQDYNTILKRMHDLLKSGGLLLIGMPRVDKFMSKLFPLIGFKCDINDYHITRHQDLIKDAAKEYKLVDKKCYPNIIHSALGLYFNYLLEKH